MVLEHFRVYQNKNLIKVRIPFTERMKEFYKNGDFPLITDPLKTRKTSIIGMFILRPAVDTWVEPPVKDNGSLSIYDTKNWVYNIEGLSGGGVIANGNVMDGYRLAMQYAITDAVIVGSNTIVNDGTPQKDGTPGYLWLPQYCADWPHLKAADPDMLSRFREQRQLMQKLGYASKRDYPAQIAVTRSGKKTEPDLLSASIFHEKLPDGSPIEAYIVTSSAGAEKIRNRAADYKLEDRIEEMLIVLSSTNNPDEIKLTELPDILFNKYNIILANHDGGKKVLEAFCNAGIIDQFNFTFGRKPSLYSAVRNNPDIESTVKKAILENFESRTINFFDTEDGSMPESFKIAEIINDAPDDAAVVMMDTRTIKNFGKEE